VCVCMCVFVFVCTRQGNGQWDATDRCKENAWYWLMCVCRLDACVWMDVYAMMIMSMDGWMDEWMDGAYFLLLPCLGYCGREGGWNGAELRRHDRKGRRYKEEGSFLTTTTICVAGLRCCCCCAAAPLPFAEGSDRPAGSLLAYIRRTCIHTRNEMNMPTIEGRLSGSLLALPASPRMLSLPACLPVCMYV